MRISANASKQIPGWRPGSKFNELRHVRGVRINEPWATYHVRTTVIGYKAWLAIPDCAKLFIADLYHYRIKYDFKLLAFVVMPEHVHLLLMPTETAGISQIMKVLKRHSSWALNQRLRRTGRFWMEDFFDHWARNQRQTADTIEYLHNNPVRRGLVKKPEDYPWSSYLAWSRPEASPYQVDREWAV